MTIQTCPTCSDRFHAIDEDDVVCLECLDTVEPEVPEGSNGQDVVIAAILLVAFTCAAQQI